MPYSLDDFPHIDQYLGEWAFHEERFQEFLGLVSTPGWLALHCEDFARHRREKKNEASAGEFLIEDGIATIELAGTMTKFGSSFSRMPFGTIGVRRAIREAARREDVRGIMLVVDSPGGTVAGTEDLALDVAEASRRKPVSAFIEDMGASAAFWVASQATRVVSNTSALVGSIGTYAVVRDVSGAFAAQGIKTHVVRAGEMKGVGEPGTEVTPAQLERMQANINDINEIFLKAVSRGRGLSMDQVREIATGEVFVGEKARKVGLVDAIGTVESERRRLVRDARQSLRSSASIGNGVETMAEDAVTAASLEEIKLYCPGADNAWVIEQLEKKATVEQVRSSWAEEQERRISALTAERDAAHVAVESAKKKPGVQTTVDDVAPDAKKESASDPIAEWQEEFSKRVARFSGNRTRAASSLAKDRPDLREAYVQAWNERS